MIRSDVSVCVIIAAYNAAATIGRAIDSALAEPEVSEVRVIDDASTDGTAASASAHDDGTGRLTVRTLPTNAGPSGARNVAIAASDAAFIAILDADDFFLPGRFAALFAASDWDLIADNIVFVRDPGTVQHARAEIGRHRIEPRRLTAIGFVEGSISQRGRYKHEFGFLKPVMSRAFLDRHGLRYAEQMRLSEDYHLYVRALIAGARFRLSAGCHYVAVEHAHSLSSAHGERDLEAVERAIVELLALSAADADLHATLRRHLDQVARKRRHRAFLSQKRSLGLIRAVARHADHPERLLATLTDIARDKWDGAMTKLTPSRAAVDEPRFLI